MKYVIIPAAGISKRMGSDVPKQFITLIDKPVLMHTINKFYLYNPSVTIIVALHKDYIKSWKKLCKEYKFDIPHQIVEGGKERFFSVKNALSLIKEEGIVAIHDAVRPLVTFKTISLVFKTAEENGSAVPVIPIKESICYIYTVKSSDKSEESAGGGLFEKINKKYSKIADRTKYFIVQTPQCFRTDIILKAYRQKYNESFTDDASVVEAIGKKIELTEGNEENIKITTPKDLIIAEALLKFDKHFNISQ